MRSSRNLGKGMDDKKDQLLRKEALDYHEEAPQGKIKVVPTKPHSTAHELSLAYSPGLHTLVLKSLSVQKMRTDTHQKEIWSLLFPTVQPF